MKVKFHLGGDRCASLEMRGLFCSFYRDFHYHIPFIPMTSGSNVLPFRPYFFPKNLILTSVTNSCQIINIQGSQEEFIHLIKGNGLILNQN